ncbi:MAG: DUF3267 domain-containing protein [Phycisphaerae bacterium]|nr:DUF3267 domain-containing protein [Phycisphaerae bacterium]
MIIPGFIIAWLTFPGVIVHEAAHLLFCRLFGLYVLDVRFFRFATTGPAGYVVHQGTDRFWPAFFVACGPFLINSVLCFAICFSVFLPIRFFNVEHWSYYVIGWLGLSIGMHAFPSNQDAKNLWALAREKIKAANYLALLVFPIVALVYVGNILSIVWADLFYAAGVGLALPELVMRLVL